MNQEIAWKHKWRGIMYGYKKCKDIYFDTDDKIKLETIAIRSYDKIPDIMNGYRWSSSILLNVNVLCDILSLLSNANNKQITIYIYSPKNNISHLNH